VSSEQRIRAVLFYLSVFIFIIGLPFILSFALGLKFDLRTLKFTKTGIILLETQPQGASVYINGKLLDEKTPAAIRELLPGNYNIIIELPKYYSWQSDVNIGAGKLVRLDKIILFPLRPNIKQLNKNDISSFWVDKEKEKVYYLSSDGTSIFRSEMDGSESKEMAVLPQGCASFGKWKVSPDRRKVFCFGQNQLVVVVFDSVNLKTNNKESFVTHNIEEKIVDAFWHSDSYHIVLVSAKNIEVIEAGLNVAAVNLVNLNKKGTSCFYDTDKDVLYFTDSERALDGRVYDNLYKLEFGTKFNLLQLQELILPKTNE